MGPENDGQFFPPGSIAIAVGIVVGFCVAALVGTAGAAEALRVVCGLIVGILAAAGTYVLKARA